MARDRTGRRTGDPGEEYPLVIGLHGYGSSPEKFISLGDWFARAGFLFAAPRAPNAFLDGENLGFDWDLTHKGGTPDDRRASELTIDYIATLVEELKSRYAVSQVFLFGFSQGAAYTYVAGFYRPELFSGLICFGFGFEPEWFPGNLLESAAGLPVFIAHGADDERVPFEDSLKARDTLLELGFEVTFHEYDGGHRVQQGAVEAAVAWLQKQTSPRAVPAERADRSPPR